MADAKITALTELAATPASDDVLVVVDTSDTTQAASGTTKKIQVSNLQTAFAPLGLVTNLTATAYVPSLSENYKIVVLPTTSASVVVELPANADVAFPLGSFLYLHFTGLGVAGSVTAGAGASVTRFGSGLAIGGQYAMIRVFKTGTNTWHAEGDLTI